MSTPDPIFILAMDHRASLVKDVYRIDGSPTPAQAATISVGKQLVFRGLQRAVADGVDRASVGVLVDELYGAEVAREARAAGINLSMPIEQSGRATFELEFGDLASGEWLEHVDRFDPDQVKVLVRFNPADSEASRSAQLTDLAAVSRALADRDRVLLLELLVPAVAKQLEQVGGDAVAYDTDLRPALTVEVIGAMQSAGVEPDIWKIEGLETTDAARLVVSAARQGGRDAVRCIILGRDAPVERLDHWLDVAAEAGGFSGFAIGRSIWEQPLRQHLDDEISDDELIAQVAQNLTHFVERYRAG
ncbi:DUF2090 domain-containing protein [Herbiconiux daphne]|uniref:DUF2090 domain-containing protein n=1 Tax=Herbiconiux daphne TaxID=2970914 RepID=A0ABT2H346_9MICO|nr:DUF2090 domain-containing protein [Herbiconiux daphne]MCS5734342.1 DUF2090 domain-containing protein [Herbiconiux daphne]